MNDSTTSGAAVFRPRREARRTNVAMMLFFALFTLFGWMPCALAGRRAMGFALFLGAISTVLFGGFFGLLALTLWRTRRPIEVGPDAIVAEGRRIPWSEVVEAIERTSPEPMIVLRLREGRSLTLRTAAYEDGAEMGRLALASVAREATPPGEDRVFRIQGFGIAAFAGGVAVAMMLGMGLFELGTPKPPRALLHPAVVDFILFPLLFAALAEGLTRYARLGPRDLTVGSILGRRSVALATVESIEATAAGLVVRTGERKIRVPKGLEGFPDLRERLLALSPRGVPVIDDLAPTPVPRATPHVFSPAPTAWIGSLLGALFTLGLAGGGLYYGVLIVQRSPLAGVAFLMIVGMPIVLGFVAAGQSLESRTRIVVDDEGIERQSIFGPRRLAWSAVDQAWRVGSMLQGYALRGEGGGFDVSGDFQKEAFLLRTTLDERLTMARERAIRTAEGQTFGPDTGTWVGLVGFLGLVGIALVGCGGATALGRLEPVRPGETGAARALGGMMVAMGLFLVALASSVAAKGIVPRTDGLEVRTLRRRRFLRWADVRRVETAVVNGRSTNSLALSLEHPDGIVRISSLTTREFDRLRGFVLAHVDPEIVRGVPD